jgi:hypothetical protein
LRDLGAASYRLEPWGDEGRLYRFSCKMPLAEDPGAVRHFEAAAADPLSAAAKVLGDVEAWRGLR